MPLDPEIAAFLESQKKLPPRSAMTIPETREFMRQRVALAGVASGMHAVEDRVLAGVPCRIYTPFDEAEPPVLVYFHGGRFISGDLETHDPLCRGLAAESGCRVVAVDYRLAPEHPFPAAVEDALSVVRFAIANHDHVAVGGDSAGANLAAVAALEMRAQLAGQLLIYPMIDAVCGTLFVSGVRCRLWTRSPGYAAWLARVRARGCRSEESAGLACLRWMTFRKCRLRLFLRQSSTHCAMRVRHTRRTCRLRMCR